LLARLLAFAASQPPPDRTAMDRLFGKSKPAPPKPTLGDATKSMETRGESIDSKIQKLDKELARYTDQMKKMKAGPAKQSVQKRALQLLKQKKLYENQKEKNMAQQFNIEQIQFAQEGLKDTADTVAAMKTANKELKKQFKAVDIGAVEDLQDDMADLLEQAEEVQSALGRSYGIDDVDEADLEAELAAMEEDPSMFFAEQEADAGEADYLSLPSSGAGEVAESSATPAAGEALPAAS